MEINQNINYKKHAFDPSQLALQERLAENGATAQQDPDTAISKDTSRDASSVSLSKKGRSASFTFDFNATTENMSKLNALGNSEAFSKAHASISYEKVKNLLD